MKLGEGVHQFPTTQPIGTGGIFVTRSVTISSSSTRYQIQRLRPATRRTSARLVGGIAASTSSKPGSADDSASAESVRPQRQRRPILAPHRKLEGARGSAPSVGSVGPLASLRPALQLLGRQDPTRLVCGFRKGLLEISLVLARDPKLSRRGCFRLIPRAHAGSVAPSPPWRSHAERDRTPRLR